MFEREKLSGTNFNDWFGQLKLVLRVEKKVYVIEQPIPPAHTANFEARVLADWNAVYDAHNELKELKSMFEKQARVGRFDLIQTFHSCKQNEGKLVSSYVLKMKGYMEQLECLSYVLPQDLSVGLIMNGLTSDFAGFVRNYNMHNMRKTIGELHALLIEYEKVYIPKPKNPKPSSKEHPAKDDTCHHCKEVGHWKRNCPVYLVELIKKKKQIHTSHGQDKVFKNEVENQLRKTIKALRSDRGGEYISQEFKDYLKACGIIEQLKPPYTPQHNGVSERRNRTLLDMVRSMMNVTTMPLSFWDYALESATCILNMVSTKKVDKTPYELWKQWVNISTSHLKKKLLLQDTSPSENISEIPMEVEGFEPPQEEVIPVRRKVCKLQRSIYGLKQALRSWNKRFDEEIKKFGFAQNLDEPSVYQKASRFKMDTSKRGYILMQERLDLNKTQGASTPKEVKRMQNIPYVLAVGSIIYAVRCTRPDVAFAQNITSRFQQNPGEPHWTAVKTILKYLRNTKDMFLVYGKNPKVELRADCYCDAGFKTDRDDTKSQTGYVFVLNEGAVDWKSSKQSTTAMSATEAEYIATMKVVWIRKFISRLGIVPTINEPIKMFCDNSAALIIANELGVQKGAKHYQRRYHYVRECIELGEINLLKVHTDNNLDDPFTKALSKEKLTQHARTMGLRLASSFI
ncbi:retrotransposon protein, putative, ty1-copia subclass [Tanacetum coccineum]|uniref:Retrotransposon protein, putative, ty1-copia subclass n=1 Tax=Tanacetum coccineum TaxID=301880 RepID=A0ABQ5GAT7_9ASTR